MNHVKCIFNTNLPRRVSSNTGVTQRSNRRNEGNFKKRSAKPRLSTIDNSFMLAVRKVYPFLVQLQHDDTRLCVNRGEMLCGTQGSKSKSIATSLSRLLSERKLPLQYVDGVGSKQAVRFGSSSSLSYDRTIHYDDDRESRSYAQMITAYNETMMTVDNASSIHRDRSNPKMNVELSRTLFKTTSTLTSSAYNFDNVTIRENAEETSMTDLSYAIDTIIDNNNDNDNDLHDTDEKTKNLDVYSSTMIPKTNRRSYANIIADYSAAMDVNSILSKYRNDFPKMSTVFFSSSKDTALETPRVERSLPQFVSSPDLGTDSRKKAKMEEELEWLSKVDKIINDLKTATGKTDTKVNRNASGLKEKDVLECVTEQAVWVDKSALTNKRKSNIVISQQTGSKDYEGQMENREVRSERTDKTSGQSLHTSPNNPTSSNLDSTSKKDWTQIPRSSEPSISADPQVELRMVPSGNESIVSVNVEAIAREMESRNPDCKELSVIVSSNSKEGTKMKRSAPSNVLSENGREGNSNFGSMRISISEVSLPVKELELSINGKPISDVRSIKARTETLDVMTSMDKVEIRVPYAQDNSGKVNPKTKGFVSNVRNAESVLKLRIATAFDGTHPVVTTGVTKNVEAQSNLRSESPKARFSHTEGNNANVKMSEVPPVVKNKDQSIQEPVVRKIEKPDDTSSRKPFGYNTAQEKSTEPMRTKIRTKYLERSNTSMSLGGGDVKNFVRSGDIDLRLTKTFGGIGKTKDTDNSNRMNIKSTTEVKKDNLHEAKTAPGSNEKKTESSKNSNLKSASGKDNVKSLADLIAQHSSRSTDGNSSGVSGKPKLGSDQNHGGSKPPTSGNKHESRTTDETKKKSTLNNQSSKTDTFDQRISPKWSPWWSSSDTYVKLKKEEDYHRRYSTPTNVTEKQKAKEFDSVDKVPSKPSQESSRASEEEKTLSAKSQDPSKPKVEERKHETKESSSASSKVRDAERTLKSSSPFKSENVQITRHDSPRVNEKSKRHSFSSPAKIADEKLNKRNEGSFKKETTRNASTSKEAESTKGVDTKDEVKVPIKETSKIDATLNRTESKNHTQENIVGIKSKDKLSRDVEKTRNEKLIRQKASSSNVFPEKNLDMHSDAKKKDSTNRVMKQTEIANNLSDEDAKLKDLLNSMKPIEKKKDGTLIDYGVKVESRKKPQKLQGRQKSDVGTSDVIKDKEKEKESGPTVSTISESKKEDQHLDSQEDIKTSRSVQPIKVSIQNPIKYNPRNGEFKGEDKVIKESVSTKDKDVNKDKNSVNLKESKKEIGSKQTNAEEVVGNNESLNERIAKIVERSKDRIPYQNVIKESVNVKNERAMEKSDEDRKNISSKTVKTEKVAGNDESLSERLSNELQRSKDRIVYRNVIKESPKSGYTNTVPASSKEESVNAKNAKTEQKSDEDIREPFEGTVIQKPSKSSSTSVPNNPGTTEPLAGTIVRRSSKDTEKRKPKNLSYKYSSNNIQSPTKTVEKANTPPSVNVLETKTNKNKDDSSGSKNNSGTPSSPVNSSGSSSHKMTKSNSHSPLSIGLTNPNESDKLRCKEKVKQIGVKSADESVKPRRLEKEMVYSAWLQRSKEKTDDKKP